MTSVTKSGVAPVRGDTISASPTILIIADRPNWAYHHIAEFIVRSLSQKYLFYLDFTCLYSKPPSGSLRRSLTYLAQQYFYRKKYRRGLPENSPPDIVLYLGWYMDKLIPYPLPGSKIIKGIFTEGFPPKGYPLSEDITLSQFEEHIANADLLVCGTQRIADFYASRCQTIYASRELPSAFFGPIRRVERPGLTVGWTGNPKRQFKGFYDYVVPAVELAQKRYPGISLKARFGGPFGTLHRFYDEVDVVLIASVADAGPSMFMEAALRGVPSIANRSGRPAELVRHGENGMLVDRDVEAYAQSLCELYENRELLRRMSGQIRLDAIRYYEELNMAGRWDEAFQRVLQRG